MFGYLYRSLMSVAEATVLTLRRKRALSRHVWCSCIQSIVVFLGWAWSLTTIDLSTLNPYFAPSAIWKISLFMAKQTQRKVWLRKERLEGHNNRRLQGWLLFSSRLSFWIRFLFVCAPPACPTKCRKCWELGRRIGLMPLLILASWSLLHNQCFELDCIG